MASGSVFDYDLKDGGKKMEDQIKVKDSDMKEVSGGYGDLQVNQKCRVWLEYDFHSRPDYDVGQREGVAKVGTVFTIGAKEIDWRHHEWVQDARTGYWIPSTYVEPFNG